MRSYIGISTHAEADRRKAEREYYLKLLRPTAFGLIFNVVPIGAGSLIFLLFSGLLVGGMSEIYVSYFEAKGIVGVSKVGLAGMALMLLSAALYESHRVLSALGINLIYGRGSTPDAHSKMASVQRGTGVIVALLPSLGLAAGLYSARNFVADRYCQLLRDIPADQFFSELISLCLPGRWSIFPLIVAWVLSGSLLTVALLDRFRESFALRNVSSAIIVILAFAVCVTAQTDSEFFVLLYRSVGPLGTITLDLVFLISLLTLLTVVCQRSEFPVRIVVLFSTLMLLGASAIFSALAVPVIVGLAAGLLANKMFELRMRYSIALAALVLVVGGIYLSQFTLRLPVRQNPERTSATASSGLVTPTVRAAYLCWLDQKGIPATRVSEQESLCGNRPEYLPAVNRPYPVFIVAAEAGGIYAASAASLFLAKLQDKSPNFVEHIFAISGVSGGAIGSTIFQALTKPNAPGVSIHCEECPLGPAQQELTTTKETLTEQIESIMGDDYLSPIIGSLFSELLGAATARAEALTAGFRVSVAARNAAAERILAGGFVEHRWFGSAGPALILNTTWLETGLRVAFAPFRLHDLDPSLYSFLDPWMPDLNCRSRSACISLISAAVASARNSPTFPPLSVRLTNDRRWNFADGGYSDGSGARSALDLYRALKHVFSPDEIDLRFILITSSNVQPNLEDRSINGTVGFFGGNVAVVESSANAAVAEACGEFYLDPVHGPQNRTTCIDYAGVRDGSLQIVQIQSEANRWGWQISRTELSILSWMLGDPANCKTIPDSALPAASQTDDQNLTMQRVLARNSCVRRLIIELIRS